MSEAIKFVKHYAKGARYLGYKALFSARNIAKTAKICPPTIKEKKSDKIKKVLLCLNRHEYGNVEWGDSYEYVNIYPALKDICEVEFFDFRGYQRVHGRIAMHEHLEKIAMSGEYDVILFSLMVDDFDRERILKISEKSPTIIINWFSDDQWRFESFSNYWAGAFNFITTTDKAAPAKYSALGYDNAIHTQWGVYAPRFESKSDFGSDIDVAFVGQMHGDRKKMMEKLRNNGVEVKCFGSGWPDSKRISQQQMVDVFANAKINISPADSSILFAPRQMKARPFEIAAAGGFQLAGRVEELGDYFKFGEEIEVYSDLQELADKIKHYLQNKDERIKISKKAHKRCISKHTYQQRFADIFSEIEARVKSIE